MTEKPKKVVPGKTIWLLWLQGWDSAPSLVQKVRESWELHNPEWNVELVTADNLSDYVDIPYINHPSIQNAAKSDIIRLSLLSEHGGVWADATLVCMMPLDRWLYDAMQPAGFWMYHGRAQDGNGPASWFIVSLRQSYITKQWKKATDEFWNDKTKADQIEYHYFWMDGLFQELCDTDKVFLEEWTKVPFLSCESEGQAHMLAGKVHNSNPELKYFLKNKPPFVVKLTYFDISDPKYKYSNGMVAIESALTPKKYYPSHKLVYPPLRKLSDYVAIGAECKREKDVEELSQICASKGVELLVYDKCNFCKYISNNIFCRPLANVGREGHTFLYFVIEYYDQLPNDIIFIPSNLEKHNRKQRFEALLDTQDTMCQGKLGTETDFVLSEYEGKKIHPADTKPFRAWFERYVGTWDADAPGPCWNGIMRTNRTRILRHPKEFYVRLLGQLSEYDSLEAGHFVERSMAAIF